ncbi:MAG TPA: hypothetical protein VGI20_06995 [Rhizomicrobium sp.]|jgi:small multidrug resistance family-3 protein
MTAGLAIFVGGRISCRIKSNPFAESGLDGANPERLAMLKYLTIWAFLIAATTLEAFGDATVRIGLFNQTGMGRGAVIAGGGVLLLGYGTMLNLAPLPFERVVGLYIATLFTVWQAVTFVTFRTTPSVPVLAGGALIIAGGLIVTFWGLAPLRGSS